jgi:hypothetical protein
MKKGIIFTVFLLCVCGLSMCSTGYCSNVPGFGIVQVGFWNNNLFNGKTGWVEIDNFKKPGEIKVFETGDNSQGSPGLLKSTIRIYLKNQKNDGTWFIRGEDTEGEKYIGYIKLSTDGGSRILIRDSSWKYIKEKRNQGLSVRW